MVIGMIKKALLVLVLLLLAPFSAQADSSLGIVGALSESPYKDTDSESGALPNLSYTGERFYIRLPEIGYHLLPKNPAQSLAVGLSYERSGFDPDDSNDANIRLLDDRDDSIMAFASYRIGPITTKLAQDISGKHDGFYAQISAGYPIPVAAWKIIPSITYRYMDSKMSNHLFGVSQSESAKTGGAIATYDSPSVSRITYGVRGIYPFTQSVNLMLGISQTQYHDAILKSPIIEDNTVTSVLAGIVLSF
jgi:outer membrane protein